MNDPADYKQAYLRAKKAREMAEGLLETKSRELYESNNSLKKALDELKSHQKYLIQQEKLTALGLLSAGIAHEINNPIAYVNSNLQTLAENLNSIKGGWNSFKSLNALYEKQIETEPFLNKYIQNLEDLTNQVELEYMVEDGLEIIKESLEGMSKVSSIIKELKNFSRSDQSLSEPVDVNECLEASLKLAASQIKHKVHVSKFYESDKEILGDKVQLEQVFLNIIINAAQAIKDEGAITIHTQTEDNQIRIEITDTGSGMDEDTLNRIFDPFFTTKDVGVGTGLGLSVSHGIIQRYGGTINALSIPDKGTTFVIRLPHL